MEEPLRGAETATATTFTNSTSSNATTSVTVVSTRKTIQAQNLPKRRQITPLDRRRQRQEAFRQPLALRPQRRVQQRTAGKAAEDYVSRNKIDENQTALARALGMAEPVRFLEGEPGAEEVVVGEVEAAEVVEVGDALGARIGGERGGLVVDVGEDLLGVAHFAALA